MSFELKNSRIWIVSHYLAINDGTPHDEHTLYAFTTKEHACEYIVKETEKFKSYIKEHNLELKELTNTADDYFAYTDAPYINCLELCIEGSIPVIFDYAGDWDILNINGKHALPDRVLSQNKIYVVKEIYECSIGGCPDLPDSAYVKLDDAISRAKSACDAYYIECTKDSSEDNTKYYKNYDDNKYAYIVEGNNMYLKYYVKTDVKIIE